MNVSELIQRFRQDMDDDIKSLGGDDGDQAWPPDIVNKYVDDAEREAAERGRLLFDRITSSVCRIPVVTTHPAYNLSELITEVTRVDFFVDDVHQFQVAIHNRKELERLQPNWRTDNFPSTQAIIIDDSTVELAGAITENGLLHLEVYRYPLVPASQSDKFEIAARNHIHLLDWMKHLAYNKRESDIYSPQLAKEFEERFTSRFGFEKGAKTWRDTHASTPHVNKIW